MYINHNMSAVRTNSQLATNNNSLSSSIQRLSSGYRINKSADDPAGMAISRKMRTQIAALEQASRNASDGISVIQTAEGALSEVQSMLQRIRELSVQAANDTLTIDDKRAVQDEIDKLSSEIDRISTDTEFNTKTLLDGTLDRVTYTNNSEVTIASINDAVDKGEYDVTVNTVPVQAVAVGAAGSAFSGPGGTVGAAEEGNISVNGNVIEIKQGETRAEVVTKLRDLCENSNITMDLTSGGSFDAPTASYNFVSLKYGSSASITITGSSPALVTNLGLSAINNVKTIGTDGQATLNSGFSTSATVLYEDRYAVIKDHSGFEMKVDMSNALAGSNANLNVYDAGPMVLQVGANENQTLGVSVPEVSCHTLGIEKLNVLAQSGAQEAIRLADSAVNMVSDVRAKLGAYQNRLESSVSNLTTTSLNITESLSRIEDVDMAAEMTKYTQYQVMVQASTAVLAQANERPQTILSLLQS